MAFSRSLVAQNLFALCLVAPLLVSARASADEACGDKVCPKGFTCETFSLGCPAIACADEASCPPCEPAEESVCVPVPCSSDADCASGMVCFTETREECEGSEPCAGDPGDADDPGSAEPAPPNPDPDAKSADCDAEPVNCTTVTASSCVPRWALPCEAAADCGAGFTCEEQLRGGCAGSEGSAGSGTPSDGAEPTPPDAGGDDSSNFAAPADGGGDCFFEPSGVFACVPVETGCTTSADCAEGWTCDANHEGACWASSDGSTGCDPVDPANICYPPYYDLGGGGFAEGNDSGAPTGGPRGDDETPPAAPSGEDGSANADSDSSDGKVESGGCSVGHVAGSSSGFSLLALSLAGLFAARRRQIRAQR
jgi:Cys-rich repeat protein